MDKTRPTTQPVTKEEKPYQKPVKEKDYSKETTDEKEAPDLGEEQAP